MQTVIRAMLLGVVALAWAICPKQALAAGSCATGLTALSGSYAFLITGGTLSTGTPKYQAGVVAFDGRGNLAGTNAYGAAGRRTSVSGTYAQNADCTYTLSISAGVLSPATFTVAVDSTGQAVGIEVDSTAVANIVFKPQAKAGQSTSFGSASLNGTYALTCSGPLTQSSDLNLVTFSNGSLSGSDPYNNAGAFAAANVPYAGNYSVNSDGTFSGKVTVGGTDFFFYGAIAPATSEMVYIYENAQGGQPIDSFAGCVGETAAAGSAGGGGVPAFSLVPSQSTLTVYRFLTGSDKVAVVPSNGFKGAVTFSASGQPAGVYVFFAPTQSASATNVSIWVTLFTRSGTYPITVTGTSPGAAPQTTTITLIAK